MLSATQWQTVNTLLTDLNPAQRMWLSGYLAGLEGAAQTLPAAALADTAAKPAAATAATVVYGSQGGNGKQIAVSLAEALEAATIDARLLSLNDYKTAWLKKERYLFIVVSTHGEGEPPDDAKVFYDFLFSTRAPQLPELKYTVLALGDSSYEHFCKIGIDIDERLQALGAQRLRARSECDTDYEDAAVKWRRALVELMTSSENAGGRGSGGADGGLVLPAAQSITLPAADVPSRAKPFKAPIIERVLLTKPPRQTLHLELSLAGANMSYRPGDAIGIRPHNDEETAQAVAAALDLEWDGSLTIGDETEPVKQWLLQQLDINRPTAVALRRYQKIIGNDKLDALLGDSAALSAYINGRHYGDIFRDFPPPPEQRGSALACVRRLAPRLYSLASSNTLHEDEAHILVAAPEYRSHDKRTRLGVCSAYLLAKQPGDSIEVYLQANDNFRLPADDGAPMIMIGPGSGIAPFRAFMEERETNGASGENWLFFGNRNRREEFYYQTEWQAYQKSGLLTRLDVAFSRDGAQKIYVQDKLRQRAGDIWQWLQKDAYIYVCGSTGMAAEVQQQLEAVVAEHNGGDGAAYMQQLQTEGRYQRDVY